MVRSLKSLLKLDSLRALQAFQLLRFSSRMIISVVFARMLPGKEMVGFYEKLLLIGQVATSFWVSGIIDPLLPYYNSISLQKQKSLIANAVFLLTLFSALACAILYFLSGSIIHSHYELYSIFLLFTLFNAPAFLMEYVLLLRKNSKGLIWYGVIVFILQTGALSIPLFRDNSLYTSLVFLAITAFIRYVILLVYIFRHYGFQMHFTELKELGRRISPYVLSLIIGSSMGYIDSLFVTHFYSDSDFAIFSYGALELPFVTLMANAFSNAMSAELSSHHTNGSMSEGLAIIRKRSTTLLHLFFPVTMVLLLISQPLFTFVYTGAFSHSAAIFNIYLLIIISRLVFPHTVLISLQKNKLLFRASAWEWVANIILDALFIYFFGMKGIAFATLVSFMLHKVILAWYCEKEGIGFSSYVSVKTWAFYSVFTIGVYVLSCFI